MERERPPVGGGEKTPPQDGGKVAPAEENVPSGGEEVSPDAGCAGGAGARGVPPLGANQEVGDGFTAGGEGAMPLDTGGKDEVPPGFGLGPRWWARPLFVSVTTLAAIAVLTLATIVQSPSAKAGSDETPAAEVTSERSAAPTGTAAADGVLTSPSGSATASAAVSAPMTGSPSSSASPSPSAVATATPDSSKALASAVKAAVRSAVAAVPGGGNLSMAVADAGAGSGAGGDAVTYDSGGDTAYDTASIVKVDILAALLLRDQRTGTQPTSEQRALVEAMIERSDNDAALALWHTIGGGAGLATANRTLGLSRTTGGPGDLWGLTQTTASDQITLLRAVFGDTSPLSPASRTYISGLMRSITAGQRWGVSAADSDGAGFALKNGWLQRSATGLWDINSIGEVTYEGHRLLISVLTSGQRSEQAGIERVEAVAKAAAKAYVSSTAG